MNPKLEQFLALIRTPDLPDLGPLARPSRHRRPELALELTRFFTAAEVADAVRPDLEAAALLWHDHLEAAHSIAQGRTTPEATFLHGVMHRREPDFGNARYWFHRLGRHDAFYAISRAATPWLVHARAPDLAVQLLPNGLWDPFAFIDACAAAAGRDRTDPVRARLMQIQRFEFEALAGHLLAA
jgi:hypothetical protein